MRVLKRNDIISERLAVRIHDFSFWSDVCYILLKTRISYKVNSTLDTVCKEDVASGGNSYYVRMFAEWLEGYGIVNFS